MPAPDELYGLPLERFVPERAALAKALRADGRRAEATDVAKLRKPSVAAWAVNQLVRTQRRAVAELLDAGDALRAAQTDLMEGRGGGADLRAAVERERQAVGALVESARGLLSSDGHELSATIVERVADTLHAAALDEAAREQVREGRLERELRHVGVGLGDGGLAASPPAPKRKDPARKPARKPAKKPARTKPATPPATPSRAETQRAERERAKAAKAARAAVAAAERRADRAAKALRVAEERRERAAKALRGADEAVETARAEAEAAAQELRSTQAAASA